MYFGVSKKIFLARTSQLGTRSFLKSKMGLRQSKSLHRVSSHGFMSYNKAFSATSMKFPLFGAKPLIKTPSRGYLSDLAEAHEMYGLFRKGQNIGYLSTLMEDPSDAKLVTKENYKDELNFYYGIPELAENIFDKLVQIKVSSCSRAPFNSPTGTWLQVIYPFAENERLADKYRKFADGHLLIGKLLEEIDALCAESAYRFIRGNNNE